MRVKWQAQWGHGLVLLLVGGLVMGQSGQPVSRATSYPATPPKEEVEEVVKEEVGEQTKSWLQLQRSGAAASVTPQQATAAERELSYQRFLESYQHAIPEYFDHEAGGSLSNDN